jgi:hypothetical protein
LNPAAAEGAQPHRRVATTCITSWKRARPTAHRLGTLTSQYRLFMSPPPRGPKNATSPVCGTVKDLRHTGTKFRFWASELRRLKAKPRFWTVSGARCGTRSAAEPTIAVRCGRPPQRRAPRSSRPAPVATSSPCASGGAARVRTHPASCPAHSLARGLHVGLRV